MREIWLFDLDGVLVIPGGYQESLKRTIGHFAAAMGYPADVLRDADIEAFEARGITCEWDISAACVAALALGIWIANPSLELPLEPFAAWKALGAKNLDRPTPDFVGLAEAMSAAPPAPTPSHAALAILRGKMRVQSYGAARVVAMEKLLSAWLGNPRDVLQSPVLRFFQHLTLGDQVFADHYGTPAEFASPSLLETLDQPALSPTSYDVRSRAMHSGALHAAILTNRPNRPALPGTATRYPPEAELALQAARLETVPLVGSGHMLWLAQQHGRHEDAYCKPNAVHALAAIGAALGAAPEAALEAGRILFEEARAAAPLTELKSARYRVTVFEDSPTGILALLGASAALRQAELEVEVRLIGIAPEGVKRAALEKLGARVYPNLDSAIAAQFAENNT
jgi:hypothetical protein